LKATITTKATTTKTIKNLQTTKNKKALTYGMSETEDAKQQMDVHDATEQRQLQMHETRRDGIADPTNRIGAMKLNQRKEIRNDE
jgi:hypothetical protein